MDCDLFITGNGTPVCEAHLQRYIDEPFFAACACEYDAWFQRHNEMMSCQRCRGAISDRGRDQVDVALPDTDGSEGRRGTADGRALDEAIVRQFEAYINDSGYSYSVD